MKTPTKEDVLRVAGFDACSLDELVVRVLSSLGEQRVVREIENEVRQLVWALVHEGVLEFTPRRWVRRKERNREQADV